MKPAPGTFVTRNVKLVRPLGKGGMGSVWVGEHTSLETEVAVKFISPEHAEKKRFVARFQREASSAAKIKSPHVVQVFDHGVTETGVPYIVMELLEGEPLSRRLKRGNLSPREAGMLVAQVCKVLTIAHDLGIVHRDLKPDNLYLVDSGYELFVKVLDFGIAKQLVGELHEITDTGAMVGTPYYMSPEMLLSPKDADHRADLWALSVVAYHAMTGQPPFRGETLAALSVAVNDGQFTPPSAIVRHLCAEIDVWFKLALCRNIEGRFASAAELALSFRQALMDGNAVSGDRSSQPLEPDSLPDTARPSNIDLLTKSFDTERAAQAVTAASVDSVPAGSGGTTTPEPEVTGDRTVTSEQLAKIRSGHDVSEDGDTLAAPGNRELGASAVSTLEGTASDGPTGRPQWGRRVGLVALLAAGLGGSALVWSSRDARTEAESVATPADMPPSASAPPLTSTAATEPSARSVALPAAPASATASHGEAAKPPPSASNDASADPRPPTPTTAKGPISPRPRQPPVQPTQPPSKAKCANPFIVDENGDLQPRPGCF